MEFPAAAKEINHWNKLKNGADPAFIHSRARPV